MLEEVSGDLGHTCLSRRTATCRFTREESACRVETEPPVVNAAEKQMKVVQKRNEETSVASFWRQEREDAPNCRMTHEKRFISFGAVLGEDSAPISCSSGQVDGSAR